MSDTVAVRGLRVRGRHGVLPEERRDGQVFVIDVVMDIDTRPAAATDDLARTVDYAALSQEVAAIVSGDPVDLIETLATRIAEHCLLRTELSGVEVTVHKPEAPVGLPFEDVSVTIRRTRSS